MLVTDGTSRNELSAEYIFILKEKIIQKSKPRSSGNNI